MRRTAEVMLTCLHTFTYEPPIPRMGDEIYCRRCWKVCRVKTVQASYQVRCQHPGCRYSRNFGLARVTAGVKAAAHVQSHPGHIVVVKWNGGIIETMGRTVPDTFDDVPPF